MSYSRFAQPLVLEPQRSRWMVAWLVVAHLLASLALFLPLEIPATARAALLLAVAVSLAHSLYRRVAPPAAAIASLTLLPSGDWWLSDRTGAQWRARLRTDSYVARWLVVLRFSGEGRRNCSVVLFPDSLADTQARRLRARLRLAAGAE